jgi:hypothetical protein
MADVTAPEIPVAPPPANDSKQKPADPDPKKDGHK